LKSTFFVLFPSHDQPAGGAVQGAAPAGAQPDSMSPENNNDAAYQEMVDTFNPDDIPF
jgi:hypothetical protein